MLRTTITLLLLLTLPTSASTILYVAAEGAPQPSVARGQPFNIVVGLGSDVALLGVDYKLDGAFHVLAQDITIGPLTDGLAIDPTLRGQDLGAVVADITKPFTGFSLIARYTLAADSDASVGDSLLTFSAIAPAVGWSDVNFVDHPFTSTQSVIVHVVPEPASFIVFLLLTARLALYKYRG